MESNKQILICKMNRKILILSGMWPLQTENEFNPKKSFYIRLSSFCIGLLFCNLLILLHFIVSLKAELDLAQDISLLCALVGVNTIYLIYINNQPKIAQIMLELSDFNQFEIPPGFSEANKLMDLCSKLCCYYTFLGAIIYNSINILQISRCHNSPIDEICGMIIPAWVPFKLNWFSYTLLFLFIFFITQSLVKGPLMASFTLLEIGHHLNLRIMHLNQMLEVCFDSDNVAEHTQNLKKCIRYHIDIIRLATNLNSYFRNAMFMHLTVTGIVCGCLEAEVMTKHDIGATIHVGGWIGALFLACFAGQRMLDASESIPDAIWQSKWYKTSVRNQKDLVFMLKRSQKLLLFETGGFGVLSYALFVAIMKTSYSVVTLLNSTE